MITSERVTYEGDPKCRHKWVLHEHATLCDQMDFTGVLALPYSSGRVHRDVFYCSRCTRTLQRRTEVES